MEGILIKLHSIVDVITNSSTEIYCSATNSTKESIEELIINILGAIDSSLTFEDVIKDIIFVSDVEEIPKLLYYYIKKLKSTDKALPEYFNERKDLIDEFMSKEYSYFSRSFCNEWLYVVGMDMVTILSNDAEFRAFVDADGYNCDSADILCILANEKYAKITNIVNKLKDTFEITAEYDS